MRKLQRKVNSKILKALEEQLKLRPQYSTLPQPKVKEDHSLALKVADEIVRMQMNTARMNAETKGLQPLIRSIKRIQTNFAANGYEIKTLLNTEYDIRMNVDVILFLDDESIEQGKKIITKVIKPQVNYNGVLIQRAQVEVSQN